MESVYLDNLVKTYELNIFRQRDYKGDDYSRAVMEVARIFSQKTAGVLAEELGWPGLISGRGRGEARGEGIAGESS